MSDQEPPISTLTEFSLTNSETISKIINKFAAKSCKLDPIPTSLLKKPEICAVLVPFIVKLVNKSLSSGAVPNALKISHVIPRLKKSGLNPDELNNYRPVANLPFLNKVLEKVVSIQLTSYLQLNGLQDPLQSAYRSGHSTESAILKIKADIDSILDAGDAALLVLLDLSAAFDTIDHERLLVRLEQHVGIKGQVIKWIRSYLTNRTQSVCLKGEISKPVALTVGVPQGSILGPLLFLLYILPLGKIIDSHKCFRHGYADDTQIYVRLPIKQPAQMQENINSINNCISEVRSWMLKNKLKINDSKTECIVFASKKSQANLNINNINITVGTEVIRFCESVKNLGAIMDSEMSMNRQISNTIKTAYYHLRCIRKIRGYLDKDTCAKVVHSCVTSRLDYHNGLLTAVPDSKIKKLQLVQNNAARSISRTCQDAHIRPVLYQLHWLPVRFRIKFKVLSFIHQSIHNDSAPQYMKQLLSYYRPSRNLRSAHDPFILTVNRSKKRYGATSFPILGAELWNALPPELRCTVSKNSFKSNLKTHLFHEAFRDMCQS